MSKKLPSKTEAAVTVGAAITVAAVSSTVTILPALGVAAVWLTYRTVKKLRKINL